MQEELEHLLFQSKLVFVAHSQVKTVYKEHKYVLNILIVGVIVMSKG